MGGQKMNLYSNSKMDSVFSYSDERLDCEVKIGENDIVVSYKDDRGVVIYKGKEIGQGHYELKCPERNGEGSLHIFPEGKILDGYWIEEGDEGFWRIFLA